MSLRSSTCELSRPALSELLRLESLIFSLDDRQATEIFTYIRESYPQTVAKRKHVNVYDLDNAALTHNILLDINERIEGMLAKSDYN